jgi:subtilisin family serine protease
MVPLSPRVRRRWLSAAMAALVLLALISPAVGAQVVTVPITPVDPAARPAASPVASPAASPVASPAASLVVPPGSAPPAPVAGAPPPPIERIDLDLLRQLAADPRRAWPVIVEMEPAPAPFGSQPNLQRARQALDLLRLHGRAVGTLPLIGGAAGFVDAAGAAALVRAPGVAFVHADRPVGPRPGSGAAAPRPASRLAAPYPRVVRANRLWRDGEEGRGVAVAVLDSGIAPDADLTRPRNRLLAAVSFAGSRGPLADPGGHGTHVAGVIAGNGARSAGQYVGIAPEAGVVDVRVLDGAGRGRVSSIVRGIGWSLANRARYNIRVLNLSFGAPANGSYRRDPLAAAAEIAWRRGLVVVAAAGNGGPGGGTVESPAVDPHLIAVGATDDQGTVRVRDDRLGWFSAWTDGDEARARPDLVAPGRRIVSLRAPGSYLDAHYPDRVVPARNGASYFRLTGTSMATPIVAGAVALLLERQPGLRPDQVKARLTRSARPYGQGAGAAPPSPAADGSGLLDVQAASQIGNAGAANRGLRPADGFARTVYPLLYGQPLVWRDPTYLGVDWRALTWATLDWSEAAWNNLAWDAVDWSDAAWDDAAWDDAAWDDAAWDDAAWDDAAWDSLTLD